jgi:hypothetical protein
MFKQIYDTKYEINELGQVRCKVSKYNNRKQEAIGEYYYLLPQQYKKSKYLYYSLRINKKVKLYTIHRLLAEHFIPNPNHYPCINHINGNKLDNSLHNLEWCTYEYNSKEAVKLGLIKSGKESYLYGIKGDNHPCSKVNKGNKYNLGKHLSEETKRKISEKLIGNQNGRKVK